MTRHRDGTSPRVFWGFSMSLVFGSGDRRFEFELIGLDLFLRIPGFGELASNAITPWCWVPWSEIVKAKAGPSSQG